uniref:Uncharacterized protein n=1 Tax=Anguilla anguilla TaxID=7936 RepID=A0A0E9WWG3_ANGAN
MERGQIRTFWRPAHICLSPPSSFLNYNCLLDIIGIYSCSFSRFINQTVLITTVRVLHPVPQVSKVFEWLFLWRFPLITDSHVLVKVSEDIYSKGVLLVQLITISIFRSFDGMIG